MAVILDGTTGISASGNITVGGVLSVGGSFAPSAVSTTGNVTGANIRTGGLVTATGNVTGGNVITSGALTAGTASMSGNVTVGNLITSGNISADRVSVSGNVTGGNIVTGGAVTAVATITGGNLVTAGEMSALGNVTGGNITTSGTLTSASLSASGNVTGANLVTTGGIFATDAIFSGNLTVDGNVTYVNISELNVEDPLISIGRGPNNTPLTSNDGKDRGEQLWYFDTAERSAFIGYDNSSGNLVAAVDVSIANEVVTVNSYGTFVVGDLSGTNISASNVTATNLTGTLQTASQPNVTSVGALASLSVIGNTVSGNISSLGRLDVTGNISANVIAANAAGLTNIPGGNVVGTVPAATIAGTVTDSTQGNITALGTLTSLSVSGNINTTGNIAAGNISATLGAFTTITGQANATNLTSGTVASARLSGSYNIDVTGSAGTAGTVTSAAQPNITSVGSLSSVSVVGTAQVGNLQTAGIVSATGNISGNYFIGNGALLTGIDTSPEGISNGTSNVNIPAVNGNVIVTVAASTVATIYDGGLNVAGAISGTGNITGGNLITSGTIESGTLSASGNVTGGNIFTGGRVSSTGNVSGGNLLTSGMISATGDLLGTNLVVTGASVTGNVSGGNIFTGGLISATGGITGSNVTTTGAVSAASVSASGNVTGGNIITGGMISATGNVTGGNISAVGLVTAATLTTTGNATIGGDLIVNGNTAYVNIVDLNVEDPIIGLGRGPNNTPLVADDGKDRGEQLWYYDTAERSAFMGWDDSAGKLIAAANVAITNEIVTVNSYGTFVVGTLEGAAASVSGNVSAGAANVTGNLRALQLGLGKDPSETLDIYGVSDASINISSAVNNNYLYYGCDYGSLQMGGDYSGIELTGDVTSPYLQLTGPTQTSINVRTSNATPGSYASISGGKNATVGAEIRFVNENTNRSALGFFTSNATSSITEGIRLTSDSDVGIGTNAPSAKLHVVGTASVTGNVTAGNVLTGGLISATGNVTGGNVLTGGLISATGNVTGGNLNLTGSVVDTGDLVLTSSAANANVTITPTGTGTIIVSKNITNGQANGVGNIGSATGTFNTIFARATSAQYADLAEYYRADAEYTPGTVVVFGGRSEVTQSTVACATAIAGVISSEPAYIMNSGLKCKYPAAVALVGRVPCKVTGNIAKGDLLVASDLPGVAMRLASGQYQPGCVIGKALENYRGTEPGVIEIVVGRL